MKLEKGKFYRTRSGEKVECVYKYDKKYLFANDDFFYTTHLNGSQFENRNADMDIISEWSDVGIPWEDYPRWCNWVAMDRNEKWFAYSIEPRCKDTADNWTVAGSYFIPSEYKPKGFTGDWKESKFERPKKDKLC